MDADVKPYAWLYGRFKQCSQNKVNDIIFDSLSPFKFENVGQLISSYFGIDISKKLGDNVFALDSFLAEEEQRQTLPRFHMPHLEGERNDEVEGEDEELEGEFDEEPTEEARENEGRIEEAPMPWNNPQRIDELTNTLNRIDEVTYATVGQTIATNNTVATTNDIGINQIQWEMPQYTINNGRVELLHRNG
jgi:hypothetical protein